MKRLLTLLIAAAVLLLGAAACTTAPADDPGSSASPATTPSETPSESPAPLGGSALIDPAKLVMACNAAFPPFEFVNDTGEFDGFDVQLAGAIADILGVELVVDDMEFVAALASISTGQADAAISAITIREDRLETMDFTTPYFETTLVAIVPEGSDITSIEQLEEEGVRIAVQFGTTSDIFCEDYLPNAIVTSLNRAPDTILELRNDRVDAIVIDKSVADQFIADNEDLVILDEALGSERYGMAVRKGNTELLSMLNNALQELRDSGEYDRIYGMFFETND